MENIDAFCDVKNLNMVSFVNVMQKYLACVTYRPHNTDIKYMINAVGVWFPVSNIPTRYTHRFHMRPLRDGLCNKQIMD